MWVTKRLENFPWQILKKERCTLDKRSADNKIHILFVKLFIGELPDQITLRKVFLSHILRIADDTDLIFFRAIF